MTESSIPPFVLEERRRLRRKRRVRLLILAVVLLLAAGIPIGLLLYSRHVAEQDLEKVIAETDRLDAEWQLEQIEKRRTAVPQDQNAAVHIAAAVALLPGSYSLPFDQELWDMLNERPQCQLDPAMAEKLRQAIQPFLPAAALAEKAVPLKQGWYAVAWKPDMLSISVEHAQRAREVGAVLKDLALLQNQDGNYDAACRTSLAILAAGRSVGEEPFIISQLVRMGMDSTAAVSLERTLAQGRVTESVLAEVQQHLAEEAAQPRMLIWLRGERATMHVMMTNAETGKFDLIQALSAGHGSTNLGMLVIRQLVNLKADHAWMLRYYNEAIEHAKLPPVEMRAKLREHQQKKGADMPLLAKQLLPALLRISDNVLRTRAQLDCATTGIAVERFRLKNDRWPDSLDEVVAAKLLDKVPLDTIDGKPLRFRKAPDGVVIYSIGPKGTYAGDALDPELSSPSADPDRSRYEFRLWDENQRRQPPPPEAVDKKEGDGAA